ncbi:MAG TPA: hypothetical protein VKS60_10245 [Stellaceae bacterium]|nr:hypothetical protein [Stellaceae bacterium]
MQTDQPDQSGEAAPAPPAAHPAKHHAKRHKHKAHIEHRVRGRIRMKVPAAASDPALLEQVCEAFSGIPGIASVTTKPHTGSIVIHYDPDREHEFEHHFNRVLEDHQHVDVVAAARPGDEVEEMARKIEAEAEFLAQRSEFARATVDFCKRFDAELKLATDNTLDLKIVLAGGLAVVTFVHIGAEAATPMWVTLALFSLNHFAELHHHPAAPAPAPSHL